MQCKFCCCKISFFTGHIIQRMHNIVLKYKMLLVIYFLPSVKLQYIMCKWSSFYFRAILRNIHNIFHECKLSKALGMTISPPFSFQVPIPSFETLTLSAINPLPPPLHHAASSHLTLGANIRSHLTRWLILGFPCPSPAFQPANSVSIRLQIFLYKRPAFRI